MENKDKIPYDCEIKLHSLLDIQKGSIDVTDSRKAKKLFTESLSESQFLIGFLGFRGSGKTFLLGQMIYQDIVNYSNTKNISIYRCLREKKENIIFDCPGENSDEIPEIDKLAQHFIENYVIQTVSAVFLILNESINDLERNISKLHRVREMIGKNKLLLVFHNCKKMRKKEKLIEKIKEVQSNYGEEFDIKDRTSDNGEKIYFWGPKGERHLVLMENQENRDFNYETLGYALKFVGNNVPTTKFNLIDSFNTFIANNHKLYFESVNDIFPDQELFTLSDSRLILNPDFLDYFAKIRKSSSIFDEEGYLCSPKLELMKETQKKQEVLYSIPIPGWKNPKASLRNIKGNQYLVIHGYKFTQKDFMEFKRSESKKSSINSNMNLNNIDDVSQEKEIGLKKIIKVSEDTNAFSLKKGRNHYLNGVFYLTLVPSWSQISKPGETEKKSEIESVFKDYEKLSEDEILILEELESKSDHKVFRAYYILKNLNIILKIYEINELDIAQSLKSEIENLYAVDKIRSEYLIKFYGAFKFTDPSKAKKLIDSNDQNDCVIRICALFENYKITMKQRLEIQLYEDPKIAYILLDILHGLIDLDKNKLPVGKINAKTIGLYPQLEKMNNKIIYKYKFFDYSATDINKPMQGQYTSFLTNLIKTMRLKKENIQRKVSAFSEINNEEIKDSQIEEIAKWVVNPKEKFENYKQIFEILTSLKNVEIPIEERVIHQLSDQCLEEIDILKKVFNLNPYIQVQLFDETTTRHTLLKRHVVLNLIENEKYQDLKSSVTMKRGNTVKLTETSPSKKINLLELETLGQGGYCKVCKSFDNGLDKFIAIKIFSPSKGLKFTNEEEALIMKEMFIMRVIQKLGKPEFFLNFYGVYEEINDQKKETVRMKLENGICNMREIVNERNKCKSTYTQNDILYILTQILNSLDFLQKNGIANRDIKPENFILTDEGNIFKYKISDFGIGIQLSETSSYLIKIDTIDGVSEDFAAPEVLEYYNNYDEEEEAAESEEDQKKYDPFLADVFSLGITILFMMGLNFQKIKQIKEVDISELVEVLKGLFPEKKYDLIFELLSRMLDQDPAKRLNFSDLLLFIKSNQDLSMLQSPEETKFKHEIQNARKKDVFRLAESCIKMAREYYSIGDMDEAWNYTKEALCNYAWGDSVYELETVRLTGLISREQGNYVKAAKMIKRYQELLGLFKAKANYIACEEKSLLQNWTDAFKRMSPEEKNEFVNIFWNFNIK